MRILMTFILLVILTCVTHGQSSPVDTTGFYKLNLEVKEQTFIIEKDSTNYEAYHKRALAYLPLKKTDNAIADLNKAIKLKPGNDLLYYDLGVVYYSIGNYAMAIINYDTTIS